jgi:hypothetical protein
MHGGNYAYQPDFVGVLLSRCYRRSIHRKCQSLPPEGPVSVTFTATQVPPAKPMPVGGGKEFMVLNVAMTASNDTGNPILNNMGGRCQLYRTIDTSTKTFEQQGYCTYADNDGDQIFERRDKPDSCKLTGGTGKFDGLQADLAIAGKPLKSNFEGITQSIGTKKGSYKIVKTN